LAVARRTLDLEDLDFHAVEIDRGALLDEAELDALGEPYRRFQITESGVSPRAIPGHPKAVYVATSNEHDERGAITEEPVMRTAQVDKRMRKMTSATGEMSAPTLYGPPEADITCVCWGTTYGPLREAVDRLNAGGGTQANMLHMIDLWPFPGGAVNEALERAQRFVAVEVNATAQLATLIRAQTGRAVDDTLLRYDGRAFTPEYILERLEG
jgi:2-oxoglutarate ferredoxin oxidoreductase subunit alpha